jgi:urea transporter
MVMLFSLGYHEQEKHDHLFLFSQILNAIALGSEYAGVVKKS